MAVLALFALSGVEGLRQEDPKAKAIREAFEEMMRAEKNARLYIADAEEEAVVHAFMRARDLPTLSHEEGAALLRVWIKGDAAYPALVKFLGNLDTDFAAAAARVLHLLTGRQNPRRDWEAWLARRPTAAACAHDDDQVRRRLRDLEGDALEERIAAESELRPCAGRHTTLIDAAIAATSAVEALARLRALRAPSDPDALRADDVATLKLALLLLERKGAAEAVALLRKERERFQGRQRKTLDLLLPALERRP